MSKQYNFQFVQLDDALKIFLDEVDNKKLGDMVTSEWTVKDVLGHICFWHQYYAKQYEALERGEPPYIHRSLAGKNEEGRVKMKPISKSRLIKELKQAHEILRKSIVIGNVPRMSYMKSRVYTTGDFIDVVIGHITRHTLQVRRAKGLTKIQYCLSQ